MIYQQRTYSAMINSGIALYKHRLLLFSYLILFCISPNSDEIVLERNLHVDGLVDGVNITHLYLYVMRTEDDSKPAQHVTAQASVENIYFYYVSCLA